MSKEGIPKPIESDLRDTIMNEKPDPADWKFLVEKGFEPEELKNKDPRQIAALVERIKTQE